MRPVVLAGATVMESSTSEIDMSLSGRGPVLPHQATVRREAHTEAHTES